MRFLRQLFIIFILLHFFFFALTLFFFILTILRLCSLWPDLLNLFFASSNVSDTWLWSVSPVYFLLSHLFRRFLLYHWIGWYFATTYQARLTSSAIAIVPIATVLRATVEGLAQKAHRFYVFDLLLGLFWAAFHFKYYLISLSS